ncbi:putative amidase [Sphingomonas changbaiensis NBRC 104936]|uniref:Putative amidase n=1 Tax=Sphingomonas changbaiensis NBRC 104936 TaxID=1219043 RepID=A0A0E9MQU1_9SPHN|nr:amidase family protein [Sphingomonas changbaiensis]GAO40142.1 putative amidase [Sphingomonas changbaiensis NBRC 104936]
MLSALQTAAAVRSGETTSLDQVEAAIARIEAGNAAINAVVVKDFDRARAQARAIDAGGVAKDSPLLGVPMTVKESYAVAGLPTTWGYAEHAGVISHTDAVAVQRLKAAGAVIVGKTNVPTGLVDLQSNNPVYGRTLNPLNPERSPGGSSGGAAASLAAGFVPAEIGSDIGGSIRTPAAFCGVWGHKPTYGVIAAEGHNFPGTDTSRVALGVMGPMARDADDLALLLDVLSDFPLPRATVPDAGALSILILPEHPVARASAEMKRTVELVGQAFERAGAEVERTLDPFPDLAAQHTNYIKMLLTALSGGAPAPNGQAMSLADWFALQDEQVRCIRAWQRLFRDYDAVIAPVFGATAFPHDDTPTDKRSLMIDGETTPFGTQFAYAGLATFPNLPSTSVPVATGNDGLPIGLQVIGDLYQDHKTIAIAALAHALMRS